MNSQDNEYSSFSLKPSPNPPLSVDLIFKISIVGARSVGKSCLFLRYLHNTFNDRMASTLGYDLKSKKTKVGSKNVTLQLFDVTGDPKFKSLTPGCFKGCHGVLVVYDITDPESFEAINEIVKSIETYAPEEAIVYLVGNKSDLESQRKVSKAQAQNFAGEKQYAYFETSAKTAVNVNETFENLAKRLVRQCNPLDLNGTLTLKNDKKQTDLRDKVCCAYY